MIERRQGENNFEYGLRLIETKIEGTVEIEWQDIVDILGLDIHRDTLRKATTGEFGSYNVLKYFKAQKAKELTEAREDEDNEIEQQIKVLDSKLIEMQKERKKMQTVSLEYNKMLREQARDELIVEQLRDIIPTATCPEFKDRFIQSNDMEWMLAFGDIHFDKFFESVNNKYSTEIIHERFELLMAMVKAKIIKEGISHITILNLGDSLEGLLRISALRTMRHGLLESVVLVARLLGDWLNELSRYVDITYRHVKTANHSELRLFNQKRGETDENLEMVIINYIHDYLRANDRVEVVIPEESYMEFEMAGYNLIACHGDSIKNIKTSLRDVGFQRRKFYDYFFMGHMHSKTTGTSNEGETNDMEYVIVPSFIGSDHYSDSLLAGSKSAAMMFGFEKGQGMSDTKKFILN